MFHNLNCLWITLYVMLAFCVCRVAIAADTDHDGLDDIRERTLYLTDPEMADTDGDGVPDGDWNERREFTYSIRCVMRILKPAPLEKIESQFQDARILLDAPTFVEAEIIVYPFAKEPPTAGPANPTQAEAAKEYLASTRTSNWDTEMSQALISELTGAGIRLQDPPSAANASEVAGWLLKRGKFREMFGTYYYDFTEAKIRIAPGLEQVFRSTKGNTQMSFEEHLQHELFGKGMFKNRVYGTCTSTAVYLASGLRAAGIPTRLVLAIPCVDTNDPQQIEMVKRGIRDPKIRAQILKGLPSPSFAAHTFNEVYADSRWAWCNYSDCPTDPFCIFGLLIQVNTFKDLSEADLAETWGKRAGLKIVDKVSDSVNPYTTLEITDRLGMHAGEKRKELPLTAQIKSALWWHQQPKGSPLRGDGSNWREKSSDLHLLVYSKVDEKTKSELLSLVDEVPRKFLLKSGSKSYNVNLQTNSFWQISPGEIVFEIVVPKGIISEIRKLTALTLVPDTARDSDGIVRFEGECVVPAW